MNEPEIYIRNINGISFTTSLDVAEKFGKQHNVVLRAIRNLISDDDENEGQHNFALGSYPDEQGQRRPMYKITRDGFALLGMGFTGKKALGWKKKYIRAFNLMEQALINQKNLSWQEDRKDGKITRREETDVIKTFIEYATGQGSTKAKFYYKHFTAATNKALFIIEDRFPGSVPFRDQLTRRQISFLATAEIVVSNAIEKGMLQGMFYKDIYTFAKSKLDNLSASVGKTPVIYHETVKQIAPRQQSYLPGVVQ